MEFGEAILQYCIGAAKPSCQCANCRWRDLSQCSFDGLPHWGEPLHLICLVGDCESTAQIRETIVQRHYVLESEVPSNRFDRNPGALGKGSTALAVSVRFEGTLVNGGSGVRVVAFLYLFEI